MRPPGPVARPPLNGASGNSCLPLAEREASFARIGRPARRGEAPQNQASGGGLRLQNACAGASARVLAALAASKHEELEAEALDDAGIYVAAGETRNDVVRRTGLSLSYREAYLAAPGASPAKRGYEGARIPRRTERRRKTRVWRIGGVAPSPSLSCHQSPRISRSRSGDRDRR
jgi:hypothetical protein